MFINEKYIVLPTKDSCFFLLVRLNDLLFLSHPTKHFLYSDFFRESAKHNLILTVFVTPINTY